MLNLSTINIKHISRKNKPPEQSTKGIKRGNAEAEANLASVLACITNKWRSYKEIAIASNRSVQYIKVSAGKLYKNQQIEKKKEIGESGTNEIFVRLAA